MPELRDGYLFEQKVLTVPATDTDINTAITTEGADDWIVTSLVPSSTNMIILFQRQVEIP